MSAVTPVTVAVTGAAGQIGYALLPRIAAGDLLGPGVPVRLSLLEITPAVSAAEGVAMELDDCAFPLLRGVDVSDDAATAFDGASIALLVGSRPRTKGMERADLLAANGAIFTAQGRALAERAADDLKVLVVGNPANTNCLVALGSASGVPPERFTAMTRLDHNRAVAQLAHRTGLPVTDVRRVAVWGNHSTTQFPDLGSAQVRVDGEWRSAAAHVDDARWVQDDFIPTVQRRGAAIIEARGSSSAASAASAAVDCVRDWVRGTPEEDWVSMAVPSDGSYGVPTGLVSSFPVTASEGRWSIVQGLELDAGSRARVEASVAELVAERDAVRALGLL